MMFHLLIILLFIGYLLATSPIHLKPGALTADIGEIFLIEDVLLVKYPYTSLTNTTDTLRIVSDNLHSMAESIQATRTRESKAPSSHHSLDLFYLLEQRIFFLQGKVDDVNRDYSFTRFTLGQWFLTWVRPNPWGSGSQSQGFGEDPPERHCKFTIEL